VAEPGVWRGQREVYCELNVSSLLCFLALVLWRPAKSVYGVEWYGMAPARAGPSEGKPARRGPGWRGVGGLADKARVQYISESLRRQAWRLPTLPCHSSTHPFPSLLLTEICPGTLFHSFLSTCLLRIPLVPALTNTSPPSSTTATSTSRRRASPPA
jgi:hypothetical protein